MMTAIPSSPRRCLASLVVSIVVCGAGVSCASPPQRIEFDVNRPDDPVIMFHRYPALPVPSGRMTCGPIVGVWLDGRIVRVRSEDTIGQAYTEGQLNAEQIQQILAHIKSNKGLLSLEDQGLIIHAASESMMIRLRGQRVTYGETVGHAPQIRHSPNVAKLREHLMSIDMSNARPCEAPWDVPPRHWIEG